MMCQHMHLESLRLVRLDRMGWSCTYLFSWSIDGWSNGGVYLFIYIYMLVYWCGIVLNLHVAKQCGSAIVCPKSQLDTKLLRFAKFPTANRSEIQVRVPNSIPALCSTQPVQIVDGPWLFWFASFAERHCVFGWSIKGFVAGAGGRKKP